MRAHEELPALVAAAYDMVLPAASEGLANVWVEALACGTPIVIRDDGGAREGLDRPEAVSIVPRETSANTRAICALLPTPPAPAVVRPSAASVRWERNPRTLRAPSAPHARHDTNAHVHPP